MRIFGSVARKEATGHSDIDILVDPVQRRFDPIRLSIHLEHLLHQKVDLVSEGSLYWLVQPQVIAEAVPL